MSVFKSFALDPICSCKIGLLTKLNKEIRSLTVFIKYTFLEDVPCLLLRMKGFLSFLENFNASFKFFGEYVFK